MDAAEEAGFRLKVNAVIMRGHNDDEIGDLANWARRYGRELRFIEFMPLEGDRIWSRDRLVPAEEIVRRLSERFPLRPRTGPAGSTAILYDYLDGCGTIGVIASVTRAFCGDCDRVRITSDGGFRTCLFATEATDLRGPLRAGARDTELADLMREAVRRKWAGHLIQRPAFQRPDRAMNAIGG
jgi:GTP 3',8-cyclase